MKEIANRIAENIVTSMSDGEFAVQVIGPWTKNHPKELKEQLKLALEEKGIQTVMIGDHLEVYVKADMDEEEKNKLFKELEEEAPSMYEDAVKRMDMQHRLDSILTDMLLLRFLRDILFDDADEDDEELELP